MGLSQTLRFGDVLTLLGMVSSIIIPAFMWIVSKYFVQKTEFRHLQKQFERLDEDNRAQFNDLKEAIQSNNGEIKELNGTMQEVASNLRMLLRDKIDK
ncbi:MAG: hypothetical protein QM523_00490 [Candidatus Pacebacteria bacterium]|nr:hypothetical protein [Candidatus Paceibacterota bacterium]